MDTIRLWYEPDGSIKVTHFVDGVDREAVSAELKASGAIHPDSESEDVDRASLPVGGIHQWVRNPKGGVMLDTKRPAPTDPLADAVDKAKTIDDLRAVIKKMIS